MEEKNHGHTGSRADVKEEKEQPSHKKSSKKEGKRIVELEAQLAEHLEGWQRAQADYKNLKARTAEDVIRARTAGMTDVLERLLPVIDNFESAYGAVPEHLQDDPWVRGIEFIRQQFEQYVQEQGLERIEVQRGDLFNPELHEAIETDTTAEGEPNSVVRVTRAGYKQGDRVLRPAGVVVAGEQKNDE